MEQNKFKSKINFNLSSTFQSFCKWSFKNSFNIGFILLLSIFVMKNDLSFEVNLNASRAKNAASNKLEEFSIIRPLTKIFSSETKENTASLSDPNDNFSNDYSNMTYHEPSKNITQQTQAALDKINKQRNYIKRFSEVARSEMRKFGIPASITLAQGLIESNAGDSRLAVENNNHFGLKCFSSKCKKGHCSNFTDDSHKDFFRKYDTAWESFRAHSNLLNRERYKQLKKLSPSDYKGWAHGLKAAGYATDKRYAEKLIHIIEEMDLTQFDN